MNYWLLVVIAILVFIGMEPFAWWMHKYILHGPLWFIHKTHHSARKGWWEANDWVSAVYGILSSVLIVVGDLLPNTVLFGVGLGIASYGVVYFIFHDIIVHQRIKLRYRFKIPYLLALIRAHKLHHKNLSAKGGEAFGFLYASKNLRNRL